MEYYSSMRNMEIAICDNMDELEDIMLSEISQTQKV